VNVHGVAGAESRDVVAQRRLVDEVQRVHRDTSLSWWVRLHLVALRRSTWPISWAYV
jgi:hypothetical protein